MDPLIRLYLQEKRPSLVHVAYYPIVKTMLQCYSPSLNKSIFTRYVGCRTAYHP